MNRGELEFLRRQFPRGSRIRLTEMVDEQWPVEPGSRGTLEYIDDVGTIHVRWDNGRGLGIVPGADPAMWEKAQEGGVKLEQHF